MAAELYLGIDGGGMKTAGVVLDAAGRAVAQGRAGGSAIQGRPRSAAMEVLAGLVDSLCRQAGAGRDQVAFSGVGLNGVDFDDEIEMQSRAIAEAVGIARDKFLLVNDGIAALWGATPAPAAAIIQHGSGITSAWRSDYGQERCFDNLNVGRIFDVRWEATGVVARMLDGRLQRTGLADKVLSHLELTAGNFAEAVFRRNIPWPRLAGISRVIFEAYEAGDGGAELLVGRAIDDYAQTAAAMVRRTGRDDATASFGGGTIAPAGEKFWQHLAERVAALAPKAKVIRPLLPPEYGAAIMAAFHAGQDAAAFYEKALAAAKAGAGKERP